MYELEVTDKDTLRRTVEVVFYLNLANVPQSFEAKSMVEAMAELFDCKPTLVNIAYQNMQNATHQPSKAEVVVALKMLGFGVRKISRVLNIHTNTIYYHLDNYIQAGQIGLAPRFDISTDKELLKFNRKLFETFGGASQMFDMKGAKDLWK